jgi:hypothetical protein
MVRKLKYNIIIYFNKYFEIIFDNYIIIFNFNLMFNIIYTLEIRIQWHFIITTIHNIQ